MKTVTILIGNSDNKLAQDVWKDFCNDVHTSSENWSREIHFSAPSVGWADWQNACWVMLVEDFNVPQLRERMIELRKRYRQNSLAFVVGDTEFI